MNQMWRPPQHEWGCDCGCCREWDQCGCEEPRRNMGVTDGVAARPGEVGEFIRAGQIVTILVDGNWTTTVQLAVIPPGDWDIQASIYVPVPVTGFSLQLMPVPTGVSGNLGISWVASPSIAGDEEWVQWPTMASAREQGLFMQPTLMPFQVQLFGTPAGTAGVGQFSTWLTARRMR